MNRKAFSFLSDANVRQRVGHIEIDTIAAERSKFTAPMLLVHGLWCTSSVWHRFIGYLAHRGWDCHAVNLRGRTSNPKQPHLPTPPNTNLAEHLSDLNAVIAACDSPPVVVGHDLGGLLALSSSLAPARAVVAISPLLPAPCREPPIPGLIELRTRIALRFRDCLPPPRGQVRLHYFGTTAPQPLVAESGAVARDLSDPGLKFTIGPVAPALIVVGDADATTPPSNVVKLAASVGVEIQQVAGGHALPWQDGWQDRAADLHRWLIRTLGDSLLAMLDEEDPD